MATLATVCNRILGVRSLEETASQVMARRNDDPYALRAIPNEDICFWIKEIDNARVVREADPQARGACWKLIGVAGATVLLLVGVLLPSASSMIAGYQIEALKNEHQRLVVERAALEVEEAKLLSPQRLEELARMQSFVDPAPQKVVYLEGAKTGVLAMNNHRKDAAR
jgi:cell division protein FtsL